MLRLLFLSLLLPTLGLAGTIQWTAPTTVTSGTSYTVTALDTPDSSYHGQGTTTVYKNGAFFASGKPGAGASTTDTGNKTVTYTVVGWSGATSTRTVTITSTNQPPNGCFDYADASVTQGGNLTVWGWATDPEMGAPVTRVDVLIDGVDRADATLGGDRNDVANYFSRPDYRYCGWSASVSTTGLASGTHTVAIVVWDNQGSSTSAGAKNFTVVVPATPPVTSLLATPMPVLQGWPFTLTATSNDTGADLTSQSIQFCLPGSSTWESGAQWTGSASANHTLTWNYSPAAAGTLQFRAWGVDAAGRVGNTSEGSVEVKAITADSDFDGDGMPDTWETQYWLNPTNPADASMDIDGDGLSNLEEYILWRNPREDNFDNRAMEVPVTITILAKGSGTVSLTVVDSKGKSVGGANGLFTSTNTADWSKSSGSPYGPSLAIGENYHLTTSATGVADYVIKVTPTLRNTSLLDAAVELNGSRADTILKTEMIAGSCTLRMVPRRLVPFAQIDCSQLEESRIFNFGFGDSRSGQSPGLITCSGGSIIAAGSRFELKIIKGPALEWSYETPTHFQGRAPAGYIEVLRTRARSTVRYYPRDDRPDSAAFKDFSAVPPIATYYIDHRINGMTITQSIAGVEMMYQDETETNESSLFYNTVESVPEGQVYVPPTEKYTTITGTKRHWRWQTPPGPNGALQGLTKTVATTHRVELLDVATPMSSWYEPIYMTVTRYNGATESAPVELFASREYAPEDFLLKQIVAEGYGVAGETGPGSGTRSIGMGGAYLIPSTLIVNSNGNRSLTNYYSEVRFGFYDMLGTSNLEGQPAIALGERKEVWHPFGDSSLLASVSSETPVTTNPVTTYSYYADPVDGEAVVSGMVSRKDTTVIGRTDYSYDATGTFGDRPTITTTEAVYCSASAALRTITRSYSRRLADLDVCGKPLSIKRPDGTQTSYVYQRGTLSPFGDWSASELGAHLLIAELTGKTGDSIKFYNPTTNPTAVCAVDPLDLEPGRSLLSQTILNADGLVLREASYVYTGANTFSLLAATYHRYDVWGNLIKKTDQPDGAGRVLFEASYSGFRKSWESDASGVRLLYTYDNFGRVASITREEASFETKSVPSVVTTYAYDDTTALVNGRGQVVRQTVSSPGETKTLVSETATDTAGRVVKTTAPGGYVTTTAYACSIDVSSLNSTTTAPDGGTTIVNYFFDGRKRSVTGTAVPDTSYTYTYAADGNLTTTETVTGTAPAVSQWSSTVTDWTGRVVANTAPARNGAASATRVVTPRYNALGQLTAQDVTSGGVKIMPTRLFAYDPYGRLLREATDTNNNNVIDLGADADVKEYEFNYQQTSFARLDNGESTGTAWYRYEGVKIYPYEGTNAATGRYFAQTYAQLSGLSDSWAAHSFGYDFDRNATESFATLDRAAKLQVATTLTTGTNQATVQRSLNGLVMASTDAQGHTSKLTYDGLGRLIGVTAPRTGLTATATAYVDMPGGNQTTTLVASVTAPDGKTTSFGYDTAGRQNRVTAPDGKIDYYQYDASGHLLYTWGATVNPVRYAYDELGRRTGMYTYRTGDWSGATLPAGFAAGGDQTTWAYDGATGLLLSKTDAAKRSTAYAYDAAGRLLTRTDARGVVTSYGYFDASYATTARFNGLPRTVTYTLGSSGAAATTNLAYTYHRTGKIKTVTDAAGTRTFNYCETWTGDSDLSGHSARLKEEVLPAGYFGSRTLTYGYQYAVAGRRNGAAASVQYGAASDYGVTYGYDDRLRLARVGTSATALPFDYGYTADSNLIARVAQWASGTSTDYSRAYTYQGNANRLANLQHTWGANIPGRVEAQLGYDSVGLRSSEATAGSSLMSALGRSAGLYTAFAYTPRRELDTTGQFNLTGSWGQGAAVAGTARDYNYDPIGNRVADQSGSYAVNALNQYTASPGVAALTYDLAGNLTSDGTRSYTFDAENRVASVVQGGVTSTFKYDYLGRRIAKTVGAVETRYVYDGWNLIAELAPTTFSIQRTYTWGLDASGSLQGAGGVGGLLCIASGANRYYPIYDGSFNVIGLYDGTGAMAAAYRYDPCGNLLQSTGTAAALNPFGFSTKFTDRETGLIYYGLRYYHAPLGRFINRDPIEEAGGINLYAFCGNDGVNRWDYLGMADPPLTPSLPPPPPDKPLEEIIPNPPYEVNGGSESEAREQYERMQRDNAANDLDQALQNSGNTAPNNPVQTTSQQPVEIRSHWLLRAMVPGQVAWDNARTAAANGRYGTAVLGTGKMLAEIGLAVSPAKLLQAGKTLVGGAVTAVENVATRTAGIYTGSMTVTGKVATYEVGVVVGDSGTILSGLRTVTQQAGAAGADTLVINTGHVVNEGLAASLMARAESGATMFGGTVEVAYQGAAAPVFRITIPVPPVP